LKNVVREDVVKISYDVDDKSLTSLSGQLEKSGAAAEKAVSNTEEHLKGLGNKAQETSNKVGEVGEKAQTGLSNISRESQKASKGILQLGSNAQKAGKHLQSIGKSISKAGNKLSLGLTAPIVAAGTASVKFAADAATSFAKVQTIADSSKLSYTQLTSGVKKASTETGIAVTDFNEALYQSVSAGIDSGKAIGFTTDMVKLAKGGFTSTESAVDVVTSALNAYGLSANQATKVSDRLITTQNIGKTTVDQLSSSLGMVIPTAKAFGVGLDSVCAGMADLTKNGIQTAEATTYLNAMLNELGKSGTVADKTLRKATGEGFTQLLSKGKSITGVLAILQDSAKKSGKSLADMFGTAEGGKAALTIMKDGGTEFNKITQQMQHSAGATQKAFEKMDATPAAMFQKEMNKLKSTSIDVGTKLLPYVTKGVDAVGKLVDAFGRLSGSQQDFLLKAAGVTALAGPALKIIGNTTSGIGKLTEALGKRKGVGKAAEETAKGLSTASKAGGLLSTAFAAIPLPAKIALAVGSAAAVGIGLAIKKANDDAVNADLAKRFGNITLSADECREAAQKLTATPWTIKLQGVAEAQSQLAGLQKSVESAASAMQKTEWKSGVGITLTADDKANFQQSADSLVQNAVNYVEQKHYTAKLSIDTILQPGSQAYNDFTKSTDSYYSKFQSKLQSLKGELAADVKDALKDGVISPDESGVIDSVETSIQGIVNQVSQEQYTAKLDRIKVEATAGGLSPASFKNLTSEIGKETQKALNNANKSYDIAISELNVQLENGEISQGQYTKLKKSLQDGLNQKKTDIELNNYKVSMGPLGDKYKSITDSFSKSISAIFSSDSFADFQIGKIGGQQFANSISDQLKSASNSIDPAVRGSLKQMLSAAKPQTDQLIALKNSYTAAGEVPPKALMTSLQSTFEEEAASGDLTHQWDLLAGKISNSSELKEKFNSAAQLGAQFPYELTDALKSGYGLVYEAGKGLVQQAKPQPSLVESAKAQMKSAGINISDAMAKSLSEKGPQVALQVQKLGNKLKSGTKLQTQELKTMYTDLGVDATDAFIKSLSSKSAGVQSAATGMVTKLASATDAQRPQMIAKLASLGGSGATSLLSSFNMKVSKDGRLVYTAKGKAGQAVKTMDLVTASQILQSPKLGSILNSTSTAQKAAKAMDQVTGGTTLKGAKAGAVKGSATVAKDATTLESTTTSSTTLKGAKAGPISGPIEAAQAAFQKAQDWFSHHNLIMTIASTVSKAFNPGKKAAGGIVGRKSLTWVAEEGYPEAIIPFNPARRNHALSLWETAGRALGVEPQKHAAGGMVSPHSKSQLEFYQPVYPAGNSKAYTDNSTYAPQFNATFGSNTAAERDLERKVKTWVSEAIQETIQSRDRREPGELIV